MFFWKSQNNRIIVPNVRMYWSNDNSITPSNVINITTNSSSKSDDGRHKQNNFINDARLWFQYLITVMTFNDNSEWIFLNEVQFCGE